MTKSSKTYVSVLVVAVFLGIAYMLTSANVESSDMDISAAKQPEKSQLATFAGGCFWCMEQPFEALPGVHAVISGYTAGHVENPTYRQVSSGTSGHLEAVQIQYDPDKVSYEKLLNIFWRQIDPTDAGGSFVDRGRQYSSAIFYHDAKQKVLATKSMDKLNKSGRYPKPIVTEIVKAQKFYPAEKYHQDYYKKSSLKYKYYRYRSGRDQYLKKIWGEKPEHKNKMKTDSPSVFKKPSNEQLKNSLTPMQYEVTQENGTERAFNNEFWNHKKTGIYVDIVSGEPLFSSVDKYDSKTGWPSFTKPINNKNIVEKSDNSFFTRRVEVRSQLANSHLGHVFTDGPAPTGKRYCINSAAMRFIPKEKLKISGYGKFLNLFQ